MVSSLHFALEAKIVYRIICTTVASLAALLVFVLAAEIAVASPILMVDQQNPGPYTHTNGAFAPISFGQSFTPTFSAIDSIDFLLGGSATVVVNLRDGLAGIDGLTGSVVIAQSLPVFVDVIGSEVFRFDFQSRVPLAPGQEYVAELSILTGMLGVRRTIGDLYIGGKFLTQGWDPASFRGYDLVFWEGIGVAEPVSPTIFGLGLAVLIGLRKRGRKASRS
jgi:hypothetical protein